MKYILLLLFLTGCYNMQPVTASDTRPVRQQKSFKETTGINPIVATLLGAGAFTLTMAAAAAAYDDEGKEYPIILGVSGAALWGAAGIVYLAEE